ncbi:phosphomannomutase/phosphoglucomutase [Pikeienuella sp. HZG-20]|uniref:phosphomannomutase/phosphoglucomutase n=1 Tax=Paludibacillus litoralis TaxID=3133267 RepID=UPI0030EC1985
MIGTDPRPRADLVPNTWEFLSETLVQPKGFREYDARWRFPEEINLAGVEALGLGLGTQMAEAGAGRDIVVGQDYRDYSAAVKTALILGLVRAGAVVHDIGPGLTPTAYFARAHLSIGPVAMVTASHNPNGWTGVKMGLKPPLTHGPEEMARLRDIVLKGEGVERPGGRVIRERGVEAAYLDDLTGDIRISRPLRVVCACGNGTAAAFAPQVLERIGVEVIPLHTELDYTFPNYNPNPEAMEMLHDMSRAVKESGADFALGFDGDGDRCGVVDDMGREIFADKMGVLLARDWAQAHAPAKFVVDVKSTGIYMTDPVLTAAGAVTEYWKTGHSHMKARVAETGALAGFEKSGHYFLAPPLGRGYDCGMRVAVEVCRLMDRHAGEKLSDLVASLPLTYSMPTLSPHCADEVKYEVLGRIGADLAALAAEGGTLGGRAIDDVLTVNGARLQLEGGDWALVRASSNTPNLVVVCESGESEARLREIFADLDRVIRRQPEVGAYDQEF